jgi:hypothetical protein
MKKKEKLLRPDLLAVFQLYCYFQHLLAVFQLLLLPGLLGLRLRCFNITFQLYRGGQFYWVEGSCLIYAICVCWRIMMSNAYCVVFFFRLVYLMFASFSGLSILIAIFDILKRLLNILILIVDWTVDSDPYYKIEKIGNDPCCRVIGTYIFLWSFTSISAKNTSYSSHLKKIIMVVTFVIRIVFFVHIMH